MHIAARSRSRQWPEWSASVATGHPLELVDDAHSAIDAMIELAIAAGEQAVEDRMDDVAIAVRTHIDVTQRVLYPMARRIGGEEGELLVDAAEAQERRLSRLVGDIDRSERFHEPSGHLRRDADARPSRGRDTRASANPSRPH